MSTIRFYPAIDLMGGEVVRLKQGNADSKIAYNADPTAQAEAFASAGASHLHVVDLDAAFGKGHNRDVIRDIVAKTQLCVQVGGGLRDLDAITSALDAGAWRVVVGSAAVENPALISDAISRFGPERIVLGLDAKNGRVKIRGWTEDAAREAADFAVEMAGFGVSVIVYTDISRDGMMGGADIEGSADLALTSGCRVVVSGGVCSLEQIRRIAQRPDCALFDGIIVGRALYEGDVTVSGALALLRALPC